MTDWKTIYDKLDDIPETIDDFRGLFTEKGGKFELTGISGVQTPANVSRLETSLKKEREAHKETQGKLGIWGDLDFADVTAKLDKYPELETAAAGKLDDAAIEEITNKRVEGVLRSKLSPLERENKKLLLANGELTEANAGFVGANTKRKVHDSMRKALRESKVLPEAEDDVLMYAGIFEITEDDAVQTRDSVGVTPGLDPAGWLAEVQDKKTHWWPPSEGGGARGSGGGGGFQGKNPFTHEGWDMTAQGQLFVKNSDQAHRMAKAAGTTVGGPRPKAKTRA